MSRDREPRESPEAYAARRAAEKVENAKRQRIVLALRVLLTERYQLAPSDREPDIRLRCSQALRVVDLMIEEAGK